MGRRRHPGKPTATVQCQQEQVAFPALQTSVWPPPLEQFTNRVRQFGQTQSGKLPRDLPDHIEFLRLQLPTTERQTTVWPPPLEQFTNRVRQFGQTQSGKLPRDLPDHIEFLRLQLPTTERQT